ncbi:MAG: pyridoxal phosphate-dependent aminotransferase [Bacteroidia bacterium]|nr:pyridoxal phosphate-dependent aminotransferase [Bacteroidia bacterium]
MSVYKGAERIQILEESQAIAMSKRSRALKAEGKDVINLSIGEPDFDTPTHIRNAAIEAIREGFTHYPPVAGISELRKAISQKFNQENNLPYLPEQIVVSTGAKQCIANALHVLVNPGEEVIIPTPYWVTYSEIVKLTGGKSVFIEGDIKNDFKVTPDQVKKVLNEKSRVFIFSSPSNPAGTVYSRAELDAFADIFAEYPHLYIISDEIYEYINFIGKHESIGANPKIFDRVITVNGVSKGFAMTGWRIGYMGAPTWIAQACEKYQGQFTSGACSIAQRAALAAIAGDRTSCQEMNRIFEKRKNLIVALAKEIPNIEINEPEGAFYLFPKISYYIGKKTPQGKIIQNSYDLCMFILEDSYVALVDGGAFGAPEYLRISFAASEESIQKGMNRIKQSLAKLA